MQELKEKTYDEKITELDQKARQQQLAEEEKLEELRKKNHDFVQFTRSSLLVLAKVQAKSGLAGAIFMFLSNKMKQDNKVIVSREALAEFFEVSKTGISNAIKLLVESKLIKVLKSGNSNIYCLNADVVWSTYGNKKEYAEFSCQVFLSKSEQGKLKTENLKVVSLKKKEEEN